MNSAASQSSSSRCVGHSPCDPRSSSTFDSPVPKNSRHVRLTNVRAVSGLSRATSQFARSRRVARSPFVSSAPRNRGIAGSTIGADSSIQLPRGRMRVCAGSTDTAVTTRGIDASTQTALSLQQLHLSIALLDRRIRKDQILAHGRGFHGITVLGRPAQRSHHVLGKTARPGRPAAGIPAAESPAGVGRRRPRERVGGERQPEASDDRAPQL